MRQPRRLFFDDDRLLETRQHILRQARFRQRKQEGRSIPPSFLLTDPRATHRGSRLSGRVEFQAEIIPADEPVKARCACSYHHKSDVAR